jgi:pyruvate/2-oxoglutarate dehydrogenase complex dihydrolipoamide dehydrogenase (E3) component
VVVIATGASPVMPEIEGLAEALKSGRALSIDQAMARHPATKLGGSVVVIGAAEGAEFALNLKLGGVQVRLIEAGAAYAPANYIGSRVWAIMGFMAYAGLAAETGKQLVRFTADGAVFTDASGAEETVQADNFVVCPGRSPNNHLAEQLRGSRFPVQVIGDARAPRSYANAIHEAAYLVRQL